MSPVFPEEIFNQIVQFANNSNVTNALKGVISRNIFDKMQKNILIYGDIQGGKTREIIKFIKQNPLVTKVLVLQNSLLVLKQYITRFTEEGIKFHVVGGNEEQKNKTFLPEIVFLLINNIHRRKKFMNTFNKKKFILILDEYDTTRKSCVFDENTSKYIHKTVGITATPFNKKMEFQKIITIPKDPNYHGLNDLTIIPFKRVVDQIRDFSSEKSGLMLVSNYRLVEDMLFFANETTRLFPKIPIVTLNSNRFMFLNGKKTKISNTFSISKIIDSLHKYPHVILVAHRMANRGLSYTDSNYSRHLTHQITSIPPPTTIGMTSFLQHLRILGIYKTKCELKLYIHEDEMENFEKIKEKIKNFNVNDLLL